MNQQQKSLRVGITALLIALVFRLFSPDLMGRILDVLTQPDTVAFLIYAETGRHVRFSPGGEILPEEVPGLSLGFAESPAPRAQEPVIPAFGDTSLVSLTYGCSFRPDVEALLKEPLLWDLTGPEPRVLIYHTHTTESYAKGIQDYAETAPYRTLDPYYNVSAIGDRVTEILEQAGIGVIHDREVHDYPDYNSSYMHSRRQEQKILREHPGILLALDIHRDAVEGPGGQIGTYANVGGSTAAQLMIVVGTNSRLPHRNWPQNLSLGLKLHAQLETQTPGIVRPLCLRPQRFNQDLCPGGLLIEVGAAGNTRQEALLAAEQLGKAIVALASGTAPVTEDPETSQADPPAVPAGDF